MKCKPIRLAVVLAIYGVVVIASMVAVTVLFSLLNERTARNSAENLVEMTMDRNMRLVSSYIMALENMTRHTADGLERFQVSSMDMGNTENATAYVPAWKFFTISFGDHPEMIGMYEMWRTDLTAPWYMTGCLQESSECYLYSPLSNETTYVEGDLTKGIFNNVSSRTVAGVAPDYERRVVFLDTNEGYMPEGGLWSPMYITLTEPDVHAGRGVVAKGGKAEATASCSPEAVKKTLTFYYCMDYLYFTSDDATSGNCAHTIVTSVDASMLGEVDTLMLSPESETYVLSVFVTDTTNNTCFVPDYVQSAFDSFIHDCGLDLPLTDGGDWDDRQRALQTDCQKQRDLDIGSKTVMMTAGVTTETGIFFVLIDVIPRSFFFSLLDSGKHVSIAISVTVCVLVVVVSVLTWVTIVVPLHWICRGLHRASTLASEPASMARKASRYTFIYEVDMLYKSYIELRTALTDLKAFVPQGLFVAPSTQETYSEAMLMALFGPSATDPQGSTEDGDGGSESTDEEDVSAVSMDTDSSAGTTSSNAAFQEHSHADNSISAVSAATTPCASAHASHIELSIADTHGGGSSGAPKLLHPDHVTPGGEQPKSAQTGMVDAFGATTPTGVPRRRTHAQGGGRKRAQVAAANMTASALAQARTGGSTSGTARQFASGTGFSSAAGIVHVFPVSQADSILAQAAMHHPEDSKANTRDLLRDAGLLSRQHGAGKKMEGDRKEQKRRGIAQSMDPNTLQSASPDKGAGNNDTEPKNHPSISKSRAKGSQDVRVPQRQSDDTSKSASPNSGALSTTAPDSPSAASLELNLNHSRVNTFRNVSCSFVYISFAFVYVDTDSLEETVTKLMDIVVKVILRCGGVIEIFRPDLVAASFGAHASMNRHAQLATLCAVTLMKKIPGKQRAQTRLVVDSGVFYVGNCGAHGRTARVVFGDRLDFALDLMKYDIGLSRVICSDRIAGILPSSFVVPVDYIVPLRNRVHGSQLFQILNPAKRHQTAYRNGANRFREAYGAAVSGDLKRALAIINDGPCFDDELAGYFKRALQYLLSQNPPRPRYCRFQLPQFELLGSEVKERAVKYLFEKLAVEDLFTRGDGGRRGSNAVDGMHAANDTLPSINFGFGDPTSSAGDGVSVDTLDPENLSRAFYQRPPLGSADQQPPPSQSAPALLKQTADPTGPAITSPPGSGATGPQAASAASRPSRSVSDALGGGPTAPGQGPHGPVAAAAAPVGTSPKKEKAPDGAIDFSLNGAGASEAEGSAGGLLAPFEESLSTSELPMTIVDHRGESWFRMPSPIGTGAFADVYKAISSSGTVMAIKCIRLSANNIQLADVVSEVNTACKLFNDYIVNYTGWAHVGGYLVIIMDFISGGSLHTALSAFPHGMPVQLAKRYALDTLKGLAYLHRNGIVHADIKPQNILLSVDGACRLGDFGSSVTKANALSCGGDVFNLRGTARYMSPEVADGATPSMASDMWSFGVTLYEMLTGRMPWVGKRAVSGPPNRHPSLPTSVFADAHPSSMQAATTAAATTVATGGAEERSEDTKPTQTPPVGSGQTSGDALPGDKEAAGTAAGQHSQAGFTAPGGAHRPSGADSSPSSLTDEEFVPLPPLSDVRFVQGLANKSIVAHLNPRDLPTPEAYDLVSRCLSEEPSQRPRAAELVDHVFFLM